MTPKIALIVGAGPGLSAAVARRLAERGTKIALASRTMEANQALANELDGRAYRCDVAEEDQVADLFQAVERDLGAPDFVLFNPSYRSQGPLVELRPHDVETSLKVTAYGGFLVAQQAAKRMIEAGGGAIFFTGASASVKGFARSAPFAMGKFALRGLAQSIARELQPQNIHVAHFIIDGAIRAPGRSEADDKPQSLLDPDAIARSYLGVLDQERSAWSFEVELRPWVESF
ncbi:SDR family NAD(P)-dependent oxidoreductase [Afifella marina]|uniref:NADP-dependent 3-hydroxy acid dehydrogenase YdfG n=1 Tax=Afifella marina DSM 2698 TaxID=1120955 RepID=A0A1G5M984_AFIMA|nr:SDR family NAD(P)-dependent oxidoreductase [Afifella marina]MBK1622794.1 oxidoreductase [Afifella marina DSM 2698]MBK1625789.1 oxidoreductase [Afifella marina]MBK5917612.1 oxidoreductase [Afifella marina]RAI23539.1 oxidoreductase [Afifella marina DSM 2698]SCZ21656.1 NADP-dependent 3-hydroxy acid dehydrogenase YdfG [Afifella marina DSM 2698]